MSKVNGLWESRAPQYQCIIRIEYCGCWCRDMNGLFSGIHSVCWFCFTFSQKREATQRAKKCSPLRFYISVEWHENLFRNGREREIPIRCVVVVLASARLHWVAQGKRPPNIFQTRFIDFIFGFSSGTVARTLFGLFIIVIVISASTTAYTKKLLFFASAWEKFIKQK